MNKIIKTQLEFKGAYLRLYPKQEIILRLFLLGLTDEQSAKLCLIFNDKKDEKDEKIAYILVCLLKEEITWLFHESSKEKIKQIKKKLNDKDSKIIKHLPRLRGSFDSEKLRTAKENIRQHINNAGEHFGFSNDKRENLVTLFWQYKSELVDSSMLTKYGLNFLPFVRNFVNEEIYESYITKPGSLIRIRSPRFMGKTFLINNLLKRLKGNQQYRIVYLTFKSYDSSILFDYKTLITYFCKSLLKKIRKQIMYEIRQISYEIYEIDDMDEIDEINDIDSNQLLIKKLNNLIEKPDLVDFLSYNENMTILLEKILSLLPENLLLVLDDCDKIFDQLYWEDFCSLWRVFFQYSKLSQENKPTLWNKLHLIIAHSTESYATLDSNKSPLANVGQRIYLKPFTIDQVQSLSKQYNLTLQESEFKDLYHLINGHPYLVNLTFNHLKNYSEETLQDIIESTYHQGSIYSSYLLDLLAILKQSENLIDIYGRIVRAATPISIDTTITWKLDGLGLIKQDGPNKVTYFCDLYRRYFQENL